MHLGLDEDVRLFIDSDSIGDMNEHINEYLKTTYPVQKHIWERIKGQWVSSQQFGEQNFTEIVEGQPLWMRIEIAKSWQKTEPPKASLFYVPAISSSKGLSIWNQTSWKRKKYGWWIWEVSTLYMYLCNNPTVLKIKENL